MSCPFSLKKSRYIWRTCAEVSDFIIVISFYLHTKKPSSQKEGTRVVFTRCHPNYG
jgi:hypothetical protein